MLNKDQQPSPFLAGDSDDASAPVEGLRAANAEIRFMFRLWAKQVYLSKGKPRKNTLANTLSL